MPKQLTEFVEQISGYSYLLKDIIIEHYKSLENRNICPVLKTTTEKEYVGRLKPV